MSLQIEGYIEVIYPVQQVKESFKKREIVLKIVEEINGNTYENFAKFQAVQNKCDIIDRFKVGDAVNIHFNIKGNKWEKDGKVNYITNLDLWKIEAVGNNATQPLDASHSDIPDTVDKLPF